MKVLLPDGSELAVPEGATGADVAQTIGARLAKAAVAVKVGDKVTDLSSPLREGDSVSIITGSSRRASTSSGTPPLTSSPKLP
jgi:threonyl-tRNA synthetase